MNVSIELKTQDEYPLSWNDIKDSSGLYKSDHGFIYLIARPTTITSKCRTSRLVIIDKTIEPVIDDWQAINIRFKYINGKVVIEC